VLSCTAVLDSAVLAANDLNDAPKILLTPKAISSWREREGEGEGERKP